MNLPYGIYVYDVLMMPLVFNDITYCTGDGVIIRQ